MLLAAALMLALPVASGPLRPDASGLRGRAEGEPTPPPPTPPPNATCGACRSGSFATPLIYFYWTNTTEQSCCDLCSANASCAFAIRSGTNCFPAPADAAGFKPGGGVTCPTADAPPWPKPPPPPFALSTWPQISALHGNASGGSQRAGTAASVEVTCSGGGCPKPEALSWYRQRLRADAPGEPDSRSQHPITAPAGGLIATVTVRVAAEEHTVMLPDTDESYKITCQPGACDVSSATTVSRHSYRCHLGCILLKMPAISLRTGRRVARPGDTRALSARPSHPHAAGAERRASLPVPRPPHRARQ